MANTKVISYQERLQLGLFVLGPGIIFKAERDTY
jgi:hypothetical protein